MNPESSYTEWGAQKHGGTEGILSERSLQTDRTTD
jgi:hypothetical protein